MTFTSASAVAAVAVWKPALTPGSRHASSTLRKKSSTGPSSRAATLRHGRSLAPSHAHLVRRKVRCVMYYMIHYTIHHMARDDAPRLHALVRRRVVRQPQQRARRAHVVAALHLYQCVCACRVATEASALSIYCTVHPEGMQYTLGGPPQSLRRAKLGQAKGSQWQEGGGGVCRTFHSPSKRSCVPGTSWWRKAGMPLT